MEIPREEQAKSEERPVSQESKEDNSNEHKEQTGKSKEASRQEIKQESEISNKYPNIEEIRNKREEILALFLEFGKSEIEEKLKKFNSAHELKAIVLTTNLIPEEQRKAFFEGLFTEILQIKDVEETDLEALKKAASDKIDFLVDKEELNKLLGEDRTEEEREKKEDLKERISSKLQEFAEFAMTDNTNDIASVLEKRRELEEFLASIEEQAERENADLSPLEGGIKYLEDMAKKLLEKQQEEDSKNLDEKLKAISEEPTEETTDPIEKAEQDRAKVIDKIQVIEETRAKWDTYSDDFKTLSIDVQKTETAEKINDILKNLREEKEKLDKIIEGELKPESERQAERGNGEIALAEIIKTVNEAREGNMGKMAVLKSELETRIVELTENFDNLSEDEKRTLKELEEWKEIVVTNEAAMTASVAQDIALTGLKNNLRKNLGNPTATMQLAEIAGVERLIAGVLEPALKLQGMKIEKEMMAVPPRVKEGVRRESTRIAEETEEIMRNQATSETPTSPIEASFEEVGDDGIENVKLGEQRIYSYKKELLNTLERNTKGYPEKKWFGLRNNKPEEKKEEDLNTIAEAIENYLGEIKYKGRANWNVAEIERIKKADEEKGEASFRVLFKKEDNEVVTDIIDGKKEIIGHANIKIEYGKEGQEYKEAKWSDGEIKRDFLITIEEEEFSESFEQETEKEENGNNPTRIEAIEINGKEKKYERILQKLDKGGYGDCGPIAILNTLSFKGEGKIPYSIEELRKMAYDLRKQRPEEASHYRQTAEQFAEDVISKDNRKNSFTLGDIIYIMEKLTGEKPLQENIVDINGEKKEYYEGQTLKRKDVDINKEIITILEKTEKTSYKTLIIGEGNHATSLISLGNEEYVFIDPLEEIGARKMTKDAAKNLLIEKIGAKSLFYIVGK